MAIRKELTKGTKFKTKTSQVEDESEGQVEPLHISERPKGLAQVIGQEAVTKSLVQIIRKHEKEGTSPKAFLFTGPSGTGKTTIARILASMFGTDPKGIIEIDAASNSGIADMRLVVDSIRYRSMAAEGKKFVIVDECHALSKATWQSLLKPIEEPPSHVYWAFCTTEPDKVPDTIRSRCLSYNLKAISEDTITDELTIISTKRKLGVSDDIIGVVSRQARGSMRKALVFLQQVIGVTDRKEAVRLLENGVGEEEQAIQLARMICTGKGFSWEASVKLVAGLEGESPEGVRLIVVNYAAAMLKGSTRPVPLLAVLDAFRGPYNASEKWAPLYLSLGTLLFE